MVPRNEIEFKHIDLNIPKSLRSGLGHRLIQTMVLLDSKNEKKCMLVILSSIEISQGSCARSKSVAW